MKNAYKVTVTSEGISLSRLSVYVVTATSVEQAAKETMKHVRRQTREKARVSGIEEVAGEFIR